MYYYLQDFFIDFQCLKTGNTRIYKLSCYIQGIYGLGAECQWETIKRAYFINIIKRTLNKCSYLVFFATDDNF